MINIFGFHFSNPPKGRLKTSAFRRPPSCVNPLNRTLRLHFFFAELQLAQSSQIGFGRGGQNVGIRALPVDDAVTACQSDAGFALTFRALRYRVHGINLQSRAALRHAFNRFENRIDRARACGGSAFFFALDAEHDVGARLFAGFGADFWEMNL